MPPTLALQVTPTPSVVALTTSPDIGHVLSPSQGIGTADVGVLPELFQQCFYFSFSFSLVHIEAESSATQEEHFSSQQA